MDASFLKVRAGRPSRAAASSARSHVVVPVGASPWISRRGDSGASPCLPRGKQDAAGRGLGVDLELEGGPSIWVGVVGVQVKAWGPREKRGRR